MRGRAKITICNHNGTQEKYLTDPEETYGICGCGYSFFFDNGRRMIVHPNSIHKLIIDEMPEEKDKEK